ncbi:hypothetical protein ACHQM5_027983 [Ranunculus cassubicifolius]
MKHWHTNILLLFIFFLQESHSQQPYIPDNAQLECSTTDPASKGNLCNSPQKSCPSYLTFRTQPPYNTLTQISLLLNSNPSLILQANKNLHNVHTIIPTNTLIIVPITNCSCSGKFYVHNSTYTLKYDSENYYTLANETYQGLTTCVALSEQNPSHGERNLSVGIQVSVPLRCACPTRNQTDKGVKFLLTYLVTWGDSISAISESFGADEKSTLDANMLQEEDLIYPFTPVLVPLVSEPMYNPDANPPPPPPLPPIIYNPSPMGDPTESPSSSNKKWVFIGIGVGSLFFLTLLCALLYKFCVKVKNFSSTRFSPTPTPGNKSESAVFSEEVRYLVDSSLNVYSFEELQRATDDFDEDNRIRGSVFRGVINGDAAAIKRTKGVALNEISALKQIHHSCVIKLSGYCIHEGNVYLVYEFAEKGSLSDWLHHKKSHETTLEFKQRIQIAYDVAEGLNYLHNYATPPHIHRDLKSSNILLNSSFRAKIANFAMSRTVNSEENEGAGEQLTRHVVGTQGYMAPEYIENGMVSPQMDVFAFGVVLLELLSGKEAVDFSKDDEKKTAKIELLLSASINEVLEGGNVREKLENFVDPSLEREYPLDLVFSMAELAKNCVAQDPDSRPNMFDIYISLSKILSSSLDWDPSDEFQRISLASH